MARTTRTNKVDNRYALTEIQNFAQLETRLAGTAVEAKETPKSKREALMNTKVSVYTAYKRGYSKDHLAKALKTTKMNITNYIQAVENGIKMAEMIRGTQVTR